VKHNKLILFLICFFAAFYVFPQDGSEKLRIAVVLIENPQLDVGIESLCDTATDTIELTLRLVNKYTVERLDFLMPEINLDRAKLYFKGNSFDNAVFGEIKITEDGEYTFLIKGWERESDSIVVQTRDRSDSVFDMFDMFDIVDDLTIKFIEELSGEHIGFGKINFINNGSEADYNIYVDGNFLGKNIVESDILFGERTFKITAPGTFGDTVIETVSIDVKENGEQNVVFSMGKAESIIKGKESDEISAIGNLFISADPEHSEIFLDKQSIGFTPLVLYGVGAGLYDLRVGSEYYLSKSQVLRLEPNIDNRLDFNLDIDPDHPQIQSQLKSSLKTELWAAGITIAQFSWYMSKQFGANTGSGMNFVDVLLVTPRFGHLLAGDTTTGTILSAISFLAYLGDTGVYDSMFGSDIYSSNIGSMIFAFTELGLMVYDMVGTPFATGRWNKKYVEKLKSNGVNLKKVDLKDPLRITIQAGGGCHSGRCFLVAFMELALF
jgi:PEGA domain